MKKLLASIKKTVLGTLFSFSLLQKKQVSETMVSRMYGQINSFTIIVQLSGFLQISVKQKHFFSFKNGFKADDSTHFNLSFSPSHFNFEAKL